MKCSKCGCPLTEGVSLFCPECGTPVENNCKSLPSLPFKVILAVVIILSLGWIALPFLRAGGNKITTLSVLDLIIGKADFDGMKVPSVPFIAPLFLIAPAICLFIIFRKNSSIHKVFANLAVFQLYHSIIIGCIWAVLIIAGIYFKNIYAYGYGIVYLLCMTLLSAFLAISFSASQKCESDSRSVIWITTAGKYNLFILIILSVMLLAGVTMFAFLSSMPLFSILALLSLISGFMAYLKIIGKDFTQWMLLSIHTLITVLSQVALLFSAEKFVNRFTGDIDFLDISGFVSPYIGTVCTAVLVFSLVYNLAFTVWSYKQLKRKKIRR